MTCPRRAVALLALSWTIALLAGCSSETSESAQQEPAAAPGPATYVGQQGCEKCHEQEAALWRDSHHDLAMAVADADTVLGDFDDAVFTYGDVTSTFFRRDGEYRVRTDGPDGALQDYKIAYVFGVVPLQQYLVEFPGGRLQALSLSWDTRPEEEGGQNWFHLYPDEIITHDDPLHWTGPNQNWNYMCAECHSTDLQKNYTAETGAYEPSWSQIDVGCEACHGPGSAHEEWAEAKERGEAVIADPRMGLAVLFPAYNDEIWAFRGRNPIAVREKPLKTRVELENCGRCHARRSAILEKYVYGRPLSDTHRISLLEDGLYQPDGQILDEVYVYGSFVQSLMYRRDVTCSDCHDVHGARLREEGNAVCSRCHLAEVYDTPEHHFHKVDSTGADCVDCHMPSRYYMVVDERHDHSMRIPRPDLSVKLGTPNTCNDCHEHEKESFEWARLRIVEWYGEPANRRLHYGEAIAAARNGALGADRLLARIVEDLESPGIARASALTLLARHPGVEHLDEIRLALGDPDPLVRSGALGALDSSDLQTRIALAFPLLKDPVRMVRLEAARVLAPVRPEMLTDTQRADLELGLSEYEQIQWVNIERVEANLNLGWVRATRGDLAGAEQAYRKALRLEPDFVPALVNLADLYRQMERDAEGQRLLQRAVEAQPLNGDVHHALGLLLARRRQLAPAVEELRRAAELRPDNGRYSYVYAVALHSAGQAESAVVVLQETHRRHPNDRDPLIALASFARDAGDRDAALRWATELLELSPGDPEAQALLADLQRR